MMFLVNRKRLVACLAAVLLPVGFTAADTGFYTDFSRQFPFVVPHTFNTPEQAMQRENGVLKVTVLPGMHGAQFDARGGKERAEVAQNLEGAAYVRQSFRVRVTPDFQATGRTMVAQIKASETKPILGSPPVAVYLDKGGRAKCNDYSSGRPDHSTAKTARLGVRLDDGQWHDVVMEYVLSEKQGFCRVTVDGHEVLRREDINTNQQGKYIFARIGLYRDAQPYGQTVEFDDWSVVHRKDVPVALR
ncbi:polysaccharide lyase-like protein [Shimia isoporae]|uniref:Polysaccharide lyase-like protein n=1 Tax=Shimia isoporae TaxID=647720 RepID=A0A4R1NNI8_9RHOB|nr:heparin lyase I family protein [Shimia isoporae]TCL08113.1 polysaccharide lyase-like protein [Shimia isoporae]